MPQQNPLLIFPPNNWLPPPPPPTISKMEESDISDPEYIHKLNSLQATVNYEDFVAAKNNMLCVETLSDSSDVFLSPHPKRMEFTDEELKAISKELFDEESDPSTEVPFSPGPKDVALSNNNVITNNNNNSNELTPLGELISKNIFQNILTHIFKFLKPDAYEDWHLFYVTNNKRKQQTETLTYVALSFQERIAYNKIYAFFDLARICKNTHSFFLKNQLDEIRMFFLFSDHKVCKFIFWEQDRISKWMIKDTQEIPEWYLAKRPAKMIKTLVHKSDFETVADYSHFWENVVISLPELCNLTNNVIDMEMEPKDLTRAPFLNMLIHTFMYFARANKRDANNTFAMETNNWTWTPEFNFQETFFYPSFKAYVFPTPEERAQGNKNLYHMIRECVIALFSFVNLEWSMNQVYTLMYRFVFPTIYQCCPDEEVRLYLIQIAMGFYYFLVELEITGPQSFTNKLFITECWEDMFKIGYNNLSGNAKGREGDIVFKRGLFVRYHFLDLVFQSIGLTTLVEKLILPAMNFQMSLEALEAIYHANVALQPTSAHPHYFYTG